MGGSERRSEVPHRLDAVQLAVRPTVQLMLTSDEAVMVNAQMPWPSQETWPSEGPVYSGWLNQHELAFILEVDAGEAAAQGFADEPSRLGRSMNWQQPARPNV
jgi:hypothetical protein